MLSLMAQGASAQHFLPQPYALERLGLMELADHYDEMGLEYL
jgi:hypothetical protein